MLAYFLTLSELDRIFMLYLILLIRLEFSAIQKGAIYCIEVTNVIFRFVLIDSCVIFGDSRIVEGDKVGCQSAYSCFILGEASSNRVGYEVSFGLRHLNYSSSMIECKYDMVQHRDTLSFLLNWFFTSKMLLSTVVSLILF